MDMKKILQALDTASSKPVEGSNDMKKFLSVVTESANPHKVALPVQMAMQHYQEVKQDKPLTIKEVKKSALSSNLYHYYEVAEKQIAEERAAEKAIISEQARAIAQRVMELSKSTVKSYKAKAEDQIEELKPHAKNGEYKDLAKNAIERREKGVKMADKKLNDPEYDKEDDVNEGYGHRRDAYERDYDSSISGMGRRHREVDDEANIMYIVVDGRLKQKMVDVRDERRAMSQGFRYEQKDALKAAGIIRSKFDPNKFIQKQGTQWVQVYPFGNPDAEGNQ